jgi:Cu/Ag efflux pump CusA
VLTYPKDRVGQVLDGPAPDLAVRVYGDDFSVLRTQANEVSQVLSKVGGVTDPKVMLQPEEPSFAVKVDLAAAQRAAIKPGDVRRAAATLLSGVAVGSLFEEQKVFDVVVWGAPNIRRNMSDIGELVIDTPAGGHVRLKDVAQVSVVPTPHVIEHQAVSRFVDVTARVTGRDVGAVARDVRTRLQGMKFPFEYHAELLGDYSSRQASQRRFVAVCLAAAIGIFLLLQAAFASWRLAAMVLLVMPAALVGGLIAVLIGGGTISVGSAVGFLAVFGLAIRSCLLLIGRCQRIHRDAADDSRLEVVLLGTRERLAPTLLTALAGVLAMLPFVLFGGGAGYEITRPLAGVVIGGLLTSTVVTLLVVPALYGRFGRQREPFIAGHLPPRPTSVDGDGGTGNGMAGDGDGRVDVSATTST